MLKWFRNIRCNLNTWIILSILFVFIISLPSLSIIFQFSSENNDNWIHIREHMLNTYIINSIILVLFIGLFTAIIGSSLAWIVSAYDFPLRNFFQWGLILPLAIPPYIGAYTYHGILNYTGVIQTTLRNQWDINVNQQYFNIMNMPGTIFIFVIFLFPYVFTITKAFLSKQSTSLIENARLLGSNSWRIYFRTVLPITRTSIVAGISLVILEVLNDYGVVKYYGIQTFTTAIFQTWFGFGDLASAIKLSGTLMIFILFLIILERILRGRKRYSFTTTKIRLLQPVKLHGTTKWLAFSYCMFVFAISFLIPFAQLLSWVSLTAHKTFSIEFLKIIANTISVTFVATTLIIIIAVVVSNASRLSRGVIAKAFPKVTILGYSIPGAVIAVGIVSLFIGLDDLLYRSGFISTYVLSTSIAMLIFAYIVRYIAVAYNSIEAGFDRVGTKFTDASRILGNNLTQSFFKVDLKMIKGAIFGGFILTFIDILKELPLTLILRPFNFETLATSAFNYATNEMIHEAALPSVLIICISVVSIYAFHYVLEKE